jgi:predicted nucleic acid-binding protein
MLGDVPEHQARMEALITSGETLVVDDATVIETVFALEKGARLSRPTIRDFFSWAWSHSISIDRVLWEEVLGQWCAHPKLSVVDVYLAATARRTNTAPLYTFDAKLANQMAAARLVPPTGGITAAARG